MKMTPQEIYDFWVKEIGPKGWYEANPDVDALISARFSDAYADAVAGALDDWKESAVGCFALLILLDQFSRNMFRDEARAFDADPMARDVARHAIANDFDLEITGASQHFMYLPFTHSETLADQDYGVELAGTRDKSNTDDALHARAHREVILRYGRFPFRNKALGRVSSDVEHAFMDAGGYGTIVRELQAK